MDEAAAELARAAARGRDALERRAAERRRAAVVLILQHLLDSGWAEAAERLAAESGVSRARVDAADNISLLTILLDYEDAYELRHGRRPRLVRAVAPGEASPAAAAAAGVRPGCLSRHPSQRGLAAGGSAASPGGSGLCPIAPMSGQLAAKHRRDKGAAAGELARQNTRQQQQGAAADAAAAPSTISDSSSRLRAGLAVNGQGCEATGCGIPAAAAGDEAGDEEACRVLKPLPASLPGELRELGAALSRDICRCRPNVAWSDVVGLEDAKRLLQEAVVLPSRYPQLFQGLLTPWRGALLHGPPGTGKTLLAKAVATCCGHTFFSISASSVVSKWRGDSEKLVRVLFELARHHAPAIIFLDEVDALMGTRGAEGEHEASRRMKSELLVQLDGLLGGSGSGGGSEQPHVFVLAATNLPWDLDPALLRRLEQRVHVPLPGQHARRTMLTRLLAGRIGPDADLDAVAEAAEGYSGADIAGIAKEAAMMPLRRALAVLEPDYCCTSRGPNDDAAAVSTGGQLQVARSMPHAKPPAALAQQPWCVELGPVSAADLAAALTAVRPTRVPQPARYDAFARGAS